MKKKFISMGVFAVSTAAFSLAFAMNHTAVEQGKKHFNNPSFAGGKKSCSTCHVNGSRLENAGQKTKFTLMGDELNSLAEAVNVCIVNANKGQAIPLDSKEMQEIVSYIKTLGEKAAPGPDK